tara:strand:+ start:300 stop:752 length:453 start_codon:yes stop_codon:yes gene_type:complete
MLKTPDKHFIFGRQEYGVQEVWLPDENGCQRKAGKVSHAPMIVFNENEPIFPRAFGDLGSKKEQVAAPYIFMNDGAYDFVDNLSSNQLAYEQLNNSLCVNFFGDGVDFSIFSTRTEIPGESDRKFVIAMPEEFYRTAFTELNPLLYKSNP